MPRPETPTPLPSPAPLPPRRPPPPLPGRPPRARRPLHLGGGLLAGLLTLMPSSLLLAASFQTVDSIRAVAQAALAAPGVQVEAALDPALRMPPCPQALKAVPVTAVNVEVQCPGGWRLFVPVRVVRSQPVLVLAQAVAPGQPLPAHALRVETRDTARLAGVPLSDPAEALGQTLRRGGRPGQVLLQTDLAAATVLRRGQPVSLIAGGPGFEVRMSGRALADAGPGEVVRVENLSSRRVLAGVVAGPGLVRVGP